VEIERKTHGNSVISASIVRQLLRRENPEEAHPFLPPETIDFLTSEAGVQLIQKIKQSDSPH
jgi:[citrate (pro-3S)-lyase] ligase